MSNANKGRCFEVHAKAIALPMSEAEFPVFADFIKSLPRADCRLVHGVVVGTDELDGIEHGHAWIETEDFVIDLTGGENGLIVPRSLYYAIAQVVDEPGKLARYTYAETASLLCRTEHFGPWDLECEL